jgi:GTPase SAR1 family protein
MAQAVKIVVCGPSRSGKTSLANYIAGLSESIGNANGKHEPTIGVRYACKDAYTYVERVQWSSELSLDSLHLSGFHERNNTRTFA